MALAFRADIGRLDGDSRGGEVRPTADLLHQLADEHRDLAVASERLRQLRDLPGDALRRTAARIVEHELAHRLLVHPLLRRDRWGRQLFSDRREEQLLLADRLRRTLATGSPRDEAGFDEPLDQQLVAHTDREEILEFPHLRRVTSEDELLALGELRQRLRSALRRRLDDDHSVIADGTWASTPRRQLPELLELPDELVLVLPDVDRPVSAR